MVITWTKTETGHCSLLDDVPTGAEIEEIDGKPCVGRCESCRKPILEGDAYYCDEEGILECAGCMEEE